MAEINSKKLTKFQEEQITTAKEIIEYKQNCEANIVSIIYKHPDEIYDINLTTNDFNNNVWKVYFEIAYGILKLEKKKTLDDVTIAFYLEKHPKLKDKYNEYGGYDKISSTFEYVNLENLDGYINELYKWKAVIKLCQKGFPVKDNLKKYIDMTYEDIYKKYECEINDIFINVDNDSKSYDICDGIDELIDELDNGLALGLKYYDMPMLNKETGGQCLGNITLVGGVSNVGKSTFARSSTIPSIIMAKEKIVIMLNEEGLKKYQRELIVWVANNIISCDLQKHTVRDGKYTDDTKTILNKSVEWLKEQTKNHIVTVIPFRQYQTSKVIKTIKKYANMGVKYFMLDTFKMDAGIVSEKSWLQMQQSMVDINDAIKPEALNVHILITFQLSKGSIKQRYYTQDNIGMAKNIVDPVSTCIMIRDLYDDEYGNGKKALKVYKLEGTNGNTEIPVELNRNKHYQILFIPKNREGSANQRQIVVEHDLSRNVMKEIGVCNVPIDF